MNLASYGSADAIHSGFRFMDLPKELRLEIIGFTDLVARLSSYRHADGFLIQPYKWNERRGRIKEFHSLSCSRRSVCNCGWCYTFPSGLFKVSRQFSMEASEVFYSVNRFIIRGHPNQKLMFFMAQPPEMLRRIRFLDLYFTDDDLTIFKSQEPRDLWDQLIEWISENMMISNLVLSLDFGFSGATWEYGVDDQKHHSDSEICRRLAKPLRRLNGLAGFHVFLVCNPDMESEMEKAAMGEDYDSEKHGKIPHTERDYRFPHIYPAPNPQR